MYPVPPCDLSCSIRLVDFFRSDECRYETIGHVPGLILRYLVIVDKEKRVGASVASWHALGESADIVAVRKTPYPLCLGVGDEVLVLQ